ncbi:MAG: hypothetical protein B6D43_07580 [Ignavibacteriales bacterium UTCHB1]|jgi:hypothetical protein|nr:MAG: hypothetical protein B6D43_07580 [Ignavibacteriales bacterium UTCHB1]
MKLISTVVFSVLFLLSLNVKDSYSQPVTITIGTQDVQSGATGYGPTNRYYMSYRIQWVITAAEISAAGGGAGNIESMAYDVSQIANGDLLNYEVRMAHTTATDASSHNTATLTTVVNSHTFTPGSTGWRTLTFDTPFNWNGTDNILVDVCWGVNSAWNGSGQVWLYNNVPNQMRGVRADGSNQCGTNTSTTRSGKPRVQLTLPPVSNPVLSVTPTLKNFGYVTVNQTSAQVFDIANVGAGTLTVNGISVADTTYFKFTDTNSYPVSLATGQHIYVTVTFTPTDTGSQSTDMTVNTDIGTATVALSGTGIQPNFGSNGQSGNNLYYFANSLSGGSGAPSHPTFAWRDTSGSTILVQNGVAFVPPTAGSLDDGRWDILAPLPAGNSIMFFGTNYTDIYINTNGVIGFAPTTAPFTVALSLPAAGGPSAAIYPLWMDMNFNYNNITGGTTLSYKVTADELIITYNRVSPYVGGGVTSATPDLYVSYQIVISHSSSPAQNSMIVLQYNWDETGIDFQNDYTSTGLSTRAHIIGLQGANDAAQTFTYRNRHNTGFQGPIFGSNLALSIGPDQNALPVDLIAFNSNVDRNNVKLTWTTSWEENNARFDIQRKVANTSSQWVTVGTVAGSGTVYEQRNYTFTDKNLVSGIYEYRLLQFDYDGNMNADFNLSNTVEIGVPSEFALSQNYPNPFNPTTKIDFQVPVEGLVKLNIVDITGREVATLVNESLTPGYYSYDFNASNLSSGVYFYRLVSKSSVITKRMMLVK